LHKKLQIGAYRFKEETGTNNEKIKITKAWASSVFQEPGKVFSAEKILNEDSDYWCSVGEHEKNEEIYLEV
jgi:hypothetical protein